MAAYTRTLAFGSSPEIIIRNSDGAWIPEVAGNVDYAIYLLWLALGNTPDVGTPPTNPPVISLGDFWARLTSAEQAAVQTAAILNGGLPTQLAFWAAATVVDLTSTNAINFLNTLVSSGCVTSARRTTILTP
ncbi:MAG TPA: hypothetical protein VJ226_09320 [Bradyrhizobium sp.]|nr:hypothetical protein [Bradyrhizobium sp.]